TDNNSHDRTAEIAREFGAKVVFEAHQQIARARNVGAAASRGRYLIFVDADTLPSDELLAATLETLESGLHCGGGAFPAFDSEPTRAAARMMAVWRWLSRTFSWAAGSYLFCLREAFDDVGGFDERFYASEELHLSSSLKKWGKPRKMTMKILDEPLITSDRKLQWFTVGQALRFMIALTLRPWRLRTREGCRFWYERPSGREEK
ncbi:MAG: glycosyltransferase, partial [Planctomycetes bacterium]|nr:glycosyltransferase [Planctomycetota bacterium]